MKWIQKFVQLMLCLGVLAGCSEPTPEEMIAAAQDGPIARITRHRFEDVSDGTDRVGRRFSYEGDQTLPPLTVSELQFAHSAVQSCIEVGYCRVLAVYSPTAMDHLEEILIYTENRLSEMGEPFDPPAVGMEEAEGVQRHGMRRHGGEGGEGGGGLDLGINIDFELAGVISEIIDGIAGMASGLGQAVEQVQDSMTCAVELGWRVLPGTLQVVDAEDPTVYDCRVRCIHSSSAATVAWCFDAPSWFTGSGPAQIATLMGTHLLEMCNPIDAGDIERFGGCAY